MSSGLMTSSSSLKVILIFRRFLGKFSSLDIPIIDIRLRKEENIWNDFSFLWTVPAPTIIIITYVRFMEEHLIFTNNFFKSYKRNGRDSLRNVR